MRTSIECKLNQHEEYPKKETFIRTDGDEIKSQSEKHEISSSHVEDNQVTYKNPSVLAVNNPIFPSVEVQTEEQILQMDKSERKEKIEKIQTDKTAAGNRSPITGSVNLKGTIKGNKNFNIVIVDTNSQKKRKKFKTEKKYEIGEEYKSNSYFDHHKYVKASSTIEEINRTAYNHCIQISNIKEPNHHHNSFKPNPIFNKLELDFENIKILEHNVVPIEEINQNNDNLKNNTIKKESFKNSSSRNTSINIIIDEDDNHISVDSAQILNQDKSIRKQSENKGKSNNVSPVLSPLHNQLKVKESMVKNATKSTNDLIKIEGLGATNNFNFDEQRRYKRHQIANAKLFFKYRYISEKLVEINNKVGRESYSNQLRKSNNNLQNNEECLYYSADDKNVIKFNCLFLQKTEKAIFLFNMKKYDDSYRYLKESNIIKNEEEFGEILLIFPGFDKFIIGEFLSKEKNPNVGYQVTTFFISKMDFRNEYFLDCFRFLLSRMNLPKDSSLILTIIDVFTSSYYNANIELSKEKKNFQDVNAVYLLASTILAINTILHRNIPNSRMIKKEDFTKMNKYVKKELCERIYDEIKINKLDIVHDYNELIYRRLEVRSGDVLGGTLARNFTNNKENQIVAKSSERMGISSLQNDLLSNAGNINTNILKTVNLNNMDELVEMLKHGEMFMKYGRNGKPHQRFVILSKDEKRITWRPMGCSCFSREKYLETMKVIINK